VYLINKKILCRDKSVRELKSTICNKAGRNNTGAITVFSKGKRWHTKQVRTLLHKRINHNVAGVIYRMEYDPNRSSFISLLVYKNKVCCYVLSIKNTDIGFEVTAYNEVVGAYAVQSKRAYRVGDSNKLCNLFIGSIISNLEKYPDSGSTYIRSAGAYGKVIKKHRRLCLIALPSNKLIYASLASFATLGVISNEAHIKQVIGKAGRNR
jgi:large subunit ribosomal protein L2